MDNANNAPILRSLTIAGYRSLGAEPQFFPKFSKINILIGQNNCGKSNVLRFIHDWMAKLQQHPRPTLTHHDRHLPTGGIGLQYGTLPSYICNGQINFEAISAYSKINSGVRKQSTLSTLSGCSRKHPKTDNKPVGPWSHFSRNGEVQVNSWDQSIKRIGDNELQELWSLKAT